MKIFGSYDKNNFDELLCDDKKVILMMEDFFKGVPLEYREKYDKNIDSLNVLKVDKIKTNDMDYEEDTTGIYQQLTNTILFTDSASLVHEFVHMSGFDSEKYFYPFMDVYLGDAFAEGMTEYLAKLICQRKDVLGYYFEEFIVEMLAMMKEELIKQAFVYDKNEFFSLFRDKLSLYNLLVNLNDFSNFQNEKRISKNDRKLIRENIRNVIRYFNILVNEEEDKQKVKSCKESFLDGVGTREVGYLLSDYDKWYKDFIYQEFMTLRDETKQNRGFIRRLIKR